MTRFHTSGTVFARLLEDDAQLCELPTSHNAFCDDLMISYDLSVLVEIIYKDTLFIFYRYCMSRASSDADHMFVSNLNLYLSAQSLRSKNVLLSEPLEVHFVELGIWFQMIAPAHAYALHKHEKAR